MKNIYLLAIAALLVTIPVFGSEPEPDSVAIIDIVTEDEATGDVAAVYTEMQDAFGIVLNPIKLFSTNPELLRHRWDGFKLFGQHETVGPVLQTMIRMLVSAEHQCAYCIDFNASLLINEFKLNEAKVMAMKEDPSQAPLSAKEKALLLFVLKAVSDSNSTEIADIEALHALGWSDAEIFFATNYAAQMVATDILINAFEVARDY